MLHDPTFWVLVAFVIFIALLFKPISGALTKALDDRSEQIKSELDEAERLREEAQTLLADTEKRLKDAAKEAEDLVASAKDEAERLKASAKDALDASLARAEKQATDRIAQAEAQATNEVRAKAVDLAIAAATSVIGDQVSGAKGDALVDAAIKDIPGKLH
ncbi:MAG: F0F1 ATP synthase subunit B [Magnetovibrionaceae bacterium]